MSGSVLQRFYSAFATRDWKTMGACYDEHATFSDPVFPDLDAVQAAAMWKMLLSSGSDLRMEFKVLEETPTSGRVHWEAWYTFSRSGRPVHNIIEASFTLKDGLILTHTDHFDFWRWSRQALGASGLLLGWTPIVRNKVRGIAAANLNKALAAEQR
ncbi:MAG TPA: nuclear transport factor 2 family protein [Flavobacteriales bacterium]|nr:nuclear transport factor 2 family protein [Flavobacteriales bacterium]